MAFLGWYILPSQPAPSTESTHELVDVFQSQVETFAHFFLDLPVQLLLVASFTGVEAGALEDGAVVDRG